MLEVKEIHECEKPSMVVGYKLVKRRATIKDWCHLRFKTRVEEVPIYETRQARFICEECNAVWNWWRKGWFLTIRPPEKWVSWEAP